MNLWEVLDVGWLKITTLYIWMIDLKLYLREKKKKKCNKNDL